MPDNSEIIDQNQPFWVIYRDDKPGPGVPYIAVNHGDGRINFGFFDLHSNPEFIDIIPEVVGRPEMLTLLKVANAPESPLMSIGCERTATAYQTKHPEDNEPIWNVASYVDLTFHDPVLAGREDGLLLVARSLIEGVDPGADNCWSMAIGLQKMPIFFGHPECWNLSIRVYGHGVGAEQADASWKELVVRMTTVLSVIIEGLAQGLAQA